MLSSFTIFMLLPLLSVVGVGGNSANEFSQVFQRVGMSLTLGKVLGLFVVLNCLAAWAERQQDWVSHQLYIAFPQLLQADLYRAISDVDWVYYTTLRKGQLIHSCTNELDRVRESVGGFQGILLRAFYLTAQLVAAFLLAPEMSFICLILGAGVLALTRTKTYQAYRTGQQISQDLCDYYQLICNHFEGFGVARCYGLQQRHTELFLNWTSQVYCRQLEGQKAYIDARLLSRCGTAVLLALLCLLSLEYLHLTTTNLLVFIFVFSRLLPALSDLEQMAQAFVMQASCFENLENLIKSCKEHGASLAVGAELIPGCGPDPSLEFCGVSFSYPNSSEPSLSCVSFAMVAGEHIAVTGPSGAGKSTLVDLMLGLMSPSSGQIKVGNQVLTGEVLRAWRNVVAYVPQETYLFPDTIQANLLWARPDADEALLWQALKLARADEFVRATKGGLHTILGERGLGLSGGERQRLALARAFLRQPKMLIMDEATSALDLDTERQILEELAAMDISLVIVTHRTNCLQLFSRQFAVSQGRITEILQEVTGC